MRGSNLCSQEDAGTAPWTWDRKLVHCTQRGPPLGDASQLSEHAAAAGLSGSHLGTFVLDPTRHLQVPRVAFDAPPAGLGSVAAHDQDRWWCLALGTRRAQNGLGDLGALQAAGGPESPHSQVQQAEILRGQEEEGVTPCSLLRGAQMRGCPRCLLWGQGLGSPPAPLAPPPGSQPDTLGPWALVGLLGGA